VRLGGVLEFGDYLGASIHPPGRPDSLSSTVRTGTLQGDGLSGANRAEVLTKPLQLSQKVGLRKVTSWKECRKARPSLEQMAQA
jgi:hypothetical protein